MFLHRRGGKIRFLCEPEDRGVIAEPVPAKTSMPDWFRKLAPVDKEHVTATDNGLTVKRCMPFLDAMQAGWLLPLAATVRLEIKEAGAAVTAGWEFDRVMVSNHFPHQIKGHPHDGRPPFKFRNYWTIVTPPGWSCLFVPPLNRPSPVFEVLAGVVDTDSYHSLINFPFIAHGSDGVHVIEKGTPLVQVIPFRRDTLALSAEIASETQAEGDVRRRIQRNTLAADGWYRKMVRAAR